MTKLELISFDKSGWEDYCYWKSQDKKTVKKIDSLIEQIFRDPFGGIGKPEALKGDLSGFWSRRINDKDRIIYTIDNRSLVIVACRGHYDDR